MFLHLNVGEYLAACYLTKMSLKMKKNGFITIIGKISGRRHCEWQLPVITRGFL